jgi:hypothetical protein
LSKPLYYLTDNEFIRLQESGVLYTLYGEDAPINLPQFKQEQYHYLLEQAALKFMTDIVDLTEADPSDIIELFENNKVRLLTIMSKWDELDWESIVEMMYDEGDDE